MYIKQALFTLLILVLINSCGVAQEKVLYKQVDTVHLYMQVDHPENLDKSKTYPAIIFFFGGGWNQGSVNQFAPQAKYFAQRGMVCFRVDYRVNKRHQTTPFESLKDAKSAIRYIREHADKYHIDTSKVVVAGASAGGQLAAAAALVDDYNEASDNLSTSCIPNALVLFNPVIDNGPGGYGYERVGDAYKDFSPLHNIKSDAPPTILFFGTDDRFVPVETAKYYQKVMEKVGSKCDLHIYEGQKHGFFNYNRFEFYKKTVREADLFLQSLGYLSEWPVVEIE